MFCLLIGPVFVRSLRRYRRRFEVRWPAPAGAAAAALGALALAGVAVDAAGASGRPATAPAATAAASTPSGRAAGYLLRAQNRDGGSAPPAGRPRARCTAAGPRSGSPPPARIRATCAGPGALDRRVCTRSPDPRRGRARAHDPRSCGRGGLTATLCRPRSGRRPRDPPACRRPDRRLRELHGFRSARAARRRGAGRRPPLPGSSVSQAEDGGFGVTRSSTSDTDMTGAVSQALAAAGRVAAARRDGRPPTCAPPRTAMAASVSSRAASNAQSTACAIQGLHAVRSSGRAVRRAIRYPYGSVGPGGAAALAHESPDAGLGDRQALAALRRAPLPIAAVPRKRGRRRPRFPATVPVAAPLAGAERRAAGGLRRVPPRARRRAPARGAPAAGWRLRAGGRTVAAPRSGTDGVSRPRTARPADASGPTSAGRLGPALPSRQTTGRRRRCWREPASCRWRCSSRPFAVDAAAARTGGTTRHARPRADRRPDRRASGRLRSE